MAYVAEIRVNIKFKFSENVFNTSVKLADSQTERR